VCKMLHIYTVAIGKGKGGGEVRVPSEVVLEQVLCQPVSRD
jgi:hypothetical protein